MDRRTDRPKVIGELRDKAPRTLCGTDHYFGIVLLLLLPLQWVLVFFPGGKAAGAWR